MNNMKCSEGKLPALNPTELENLKFRISSPEQSERLQKVLFELGYTWVIVEPNKVCNTDKFWLYIYEDGRITWDYTYSNFVSHNNEEHDTEAFIEKYTTVTLDKTQTIDKHYSFDYKLTEDDIKKGSIKIDPYFVSQEWQLGAKDNTGVIFHCLKNIARFGVKNSKEREITALYKQIVRLAELEGIVLK